MSGLPFDPSDPAVRRWLTDLNVALDDVDAVVRDMLRRHRRRELGPRQHRRLYKEGYEKLTAMLGRRLPEPPAAEGGPTPH